MAADLDPDDPHREPGPLRGLSKSDRARHRMLQHKEAFLKAVRGGAPQIHASRACGVSDRTARDWLTRGRDETERLENLRNMGEDPPRDPIEGEFADLYEEYEEARSYAVMRNVVDIQKAAHGGYVTQEATKTYTDSSGKTVTETTKTIAGPDWRAAAWYLERVDRPHFGKQAVDAPDSNSAVQLGGVDLTALSARIGAAAALAVQAEQERRAVTAQDTVTVEQVPDA